MIAQYNASQLLTMREVSPCKHCYSCSQAGRLLSQALAMLGPACSCKAARCCVSQRPCLISHNTGWMPGATPALTPSGRQQYCRQLHLRPLQVVSRDIRRILTQRAAYFNIYLDDVSITQLTFSREYTHAVEAKQVAQQDAERARFIVSLREA